MHAGELDLVEDVHGAVHCPLRARGCFSTANNAVDVWKCHGTDDARCSVGFQALLLQIAEHEQCVRCWHSRVKCTGTLLCFVVLFDDRDSYSRVVHFDCT